ncbi:MAG: biotin--[acetyl-CoA-carboxylase] ligase [Candidatus Eisenbacteria bacterium]|uniref:biotin--[biotin carboxyl-carrier protein] ligase n=1 Tax=Eiseniibacteriota bacterium TaxID=2212470 RepID=A0A948RXV3_UNCEI|nr:biotin--[acetyl-CoA-carboxylase] ligase [Candidatus Eisenbacteria bacterium]MBU1948877.1 biotin--[acetyl-CoA-carboxylase] ligase [Candidatus Eisenbacteria bacterium]MBU2691558.1 biotin--[acetyl-CoA-carboxylase] ligase [Candidatus Eisenbacteria bacterium]
MKKEDPATSFAAAVKALLTTDSFGRELIYLPETTSTNQIAAEYAERGHAEGMVIAAGSQTEGRGRFQRVWYSPPDDNLYFSLILRPSKPPSVIPQLSLMAGIAVARAIQSVTPGLPVGTKWPNDVLIGERKVCGILCELRTDADIIRHVILGAGVNVNIEQGGFPPELEKTATSLKIAAGRSVPRPRLLATILAEMEWMYDQWRNLGFDSLLDEWRKVSILGGRRVTVVTMNQRIRGSVDGLAPSGALLLRGDDGGIQEIHSGDVHLEDWKDS